MIRPGTLDGQRPDPDPIHPDFRLGETVASARGEPGPTRLDLLEATIGPVPRVDLRDADEGGDPVVTEPSPRPDLGLGGSIRYLIDGEIARGGMGSVLRGRDPDIGREIALKVLREDFRDDAGMIRRFVEEAQIGGQLQHPGIVPIYEMGVFGDRRPFFAMKLIKGETLADRLARRAGPGDDLPRLVAIFEAVTQAVAYAHARGVIHRDLKPANIMLGSFGEVQVMDWGLAKVLPRSGKAATAEAPPHETVIATARGAAGDPTLSQAGSAMGTPSYMAPEQARGEVDQIDERADVFALGSILCEVLTGQPAFEGRSGGVILRRAALGDLADAHARFDACPADADLVALARHCLAPEPEDRPPSAGAVALRVAAHLAGVQDRLRRAEIGAVEERARRRLTTVTAAAVLLLGLLGAGGYGWNQQQRGIRLARTARAVDDALTDAVRFRAEAAATPADSDTPRWAEARSAIRRAESLLAQGETDSLLLTRVATLRAAIDRDATVADDRITARRIDRDLLARLEAAQDGLADLHDFARTDSDYAAAFLAAGLELDTSSSAKAARWLAARGNPVELATHIDQWALVRFEDSQPPANWVGLTALARAADPDPWRNSLRKLVFAKSIHFLRRDRFMEKVLHRMADDQVALASQPASSLVLLSRLLKNIAEDTDRATRVLRLAVSLYPDDYWAHFALAGVRGVTGSYIENQRYPNPEEAVLHLTAATAIRPKSSRIHYALGMALSGQGRRDEAEAEYRVAIRLRPDYADAHRHLGDLLYNQAKYIEAEAEYRTVILLKPDFAAAHYNLGTALYSQSKYAEAEVEYRTAIKLKPDFAEAHNNLGNALFSQSKYVEAEAEYRAAFRIMPDNPNLMNALADLLTNHVDTTRRDPVAAVELATKAVALKPNEPAFRNTLGQAEFRAGKFDVALEDLTKSMQMSDGGNPEDWYFVAMIHSKQGRADEARRWLDKANEWVEKKDPGNARFKQYRAEAEGLIVPSGGNAQPEKR